MLAISMEAGMEYFVVCKVGRILDKDNRSTYISGERINYKSSKFIIVLVLYFVLTRRL